MLYSNWLITYNLRVMLIVCANFDRIALYRLRATKEFVNTLCRNHPSTESHALMPLRVILLYMKCFISLCSGMKQCQMNDLTKCPMMRCHLKWFDVFLNDAIYVKTACVTVKPFITKVCRGKTTERQQNAGSERTGRRDFTPEAHLVTSGEGSDSEYSLYQVGKTDRAVKIELEIAGKPVPMIIDTGATKTIINEQTYNKLKEDLPPLNPSSAVLTTYTGQTIPVLGALQVSVIYEKQKNHLPALVVRSKGPNLFGRNWIEAIKLNWDSIFCVNPEKVYSQLKKVLNATRKFLQKT